MAEKPFTWWWPQSSAGNAAFWVVIAISALTVFVGGPFAVINVAFWYLVAVGVRFVYLKASGKGPPGGTDQPR